jgi:hypothetical protein
MLRSVVAARRTREGGTHQGQGCRPLDARVHWIRFSSCVVRSPRGLNRCPSSECPHGACHRNCWSMRPQHDVRCGGRRRGDASTRGRASPWPSQTAQATARNEMVSRTTVFARAQIIALGAIGGRKPARTDRAHRWLRDRSFPGVRGSSRHRQRDFRSGVRIHPSSSPSPRELRGDERRGRRRRVNERFVRRARAHGRCRRKRR